MKRDLKLNMSHLDAISRKVQSYIAVRDFLNNSELQGQAFDNLWMQMEDYLMILRTMREANCSDISDFNTLSGSVGGWGYPLFKISLFQMWAAKFGFGIGAGATIWGMEEKRRKVWCNR